MGERKTCEKRWKSSKSWDKTRHVKIQHCFFSSSPFLRIKFDVNCVPEFTSCLHNLSYTGWGNTQKTFQILSDLESIFRRLRGLKGPATSP